MEEGINPPDPGAQSRAGGILDSPSARGSADYVDTIPRRRGARQIALRPAPLRGERASPEEKRLDVKSRPLAPTYDAIVPRIGRTVQAPLSLSEYSKNPLEMLLEPLLNIF